jgi:hypothetical protein
VVAEFIPRMTAPSSQRKAYDYAERIRARLPGRLRELKMRWGSGVSTFAEALVDKSVAAEAMTDKVREAPH